MRDSKSLLALGLLLLAPLQVSALGLGRVTVHSGLNQPLNATVPLLDARDPDSLVVKLADPKEFDKLGLPYPALGDLRFQVENGVLHITTRKAVREPILDLVIQLEGREGRMLKDYSLLLDPPRTVYAHAAAQPAPKRQAEAPAPRPARAAPPVALGGSYTVHRGDTLSALAKRMAPPGMVHADLENALLAANPGAFIDGDPNRLRAGAVLKVPEGAEVAEPRPPAAPARSEAPAAGVRPVVGRVEALPEEPAAAKKGARGRPGLSIVPPPAEFNEELLRRAQESNDQLQKQNEELRAQLTRLDEQLKVLTAQVLAATQPQAQAGASAKAAPPPPPAKAAPAAAVPPPVVGEGSARGVVERPEPAGTEGASQPPAAGSAVVPVAVVETPVPRPEPSGSSGLPWAGISVGALAVAGGLFVWWRRRREAELPFAAHWDE